MNAVKLYRKNTSKRFFEKKKEGNYITFRVDSFNLTDSQKLLLVKKLAVRRRKKLQTELRAGINMK